MNLRNLAGSLSFAHLAGLSPRSKKAEKESAAASETDETCDDDEEMQAAETEEPDESASADGEDGKKSKKGKAKNAKPDDESDDDGDGDPDDDDTDETDDEDAKKATSAEQRAFARGKKAGQKAERARGGAIFASAAAAGNVELAAKLAFTTDLSAASAKAILEASPRNSGLRDRMAQGPQTRVPPGSGKPAGGAAAADALWNSALAEYMPARQ